VAGEGRTVKIVRTGITRTVVLTRCWAIKVPTLRGLGDPDRSGARIASFCRGVLANQSERDWSAVEGVNPVVWSFRNLVNVYRRTEPVDELNVPDDIYDQLCPDWAPVGDRKPDNIGRLDGRIVWIDYDHSWTGIRDVRARTVDTRR
jgi:hypothetical protein